jgi:hypothetical protein
MYFVLFFRFFRNSKDTNRREPATSDGKPITRRETVMATFFRYDVAWSCAFDLLKGATVQKEDVLNFVCPATITVHGRQRVHGGDAAIVIPCSTMTKIHACG